MYDRLLVPTDGSRSMRRVIVHARKLAKRHDSEIHGLYVVDTGGYTTMPVETAWDGITGLLREEGDVALAELRALVEDVPVETTVAHGSPSAEIVAYARDYDCDLIVMGTHGRGGIDRLLLGSVAERVVRTSPGPVVTVPIRDVPVDEQAPRDALDGRTTPDGGVHSRPQRQ